jgi:hypothetical protein
MCKQNCQKKESSEEQDYGKHILVYASIILFVGAFVTALAPYLLSKLSFIYFSDKPNEIGDTIGGITAPFVNLTSSALVFLALWAQIKANKIVQSQIDNQNEDGIKQKNFALLLEIFKQMKGDFDEFEFVTTVQTGEFTVEPFRNRGRNSLRLLYEKIHNTTKEEVDLQDSEHKTEYAVLLNTFEVFDLFTKRLTSDQLSDSDKSTLTELSKYLFSSRFESLVPEEFELPIEFFNIIKSISANLNLPTKVKEPAQF